MKTSEVSSPPSSSEQSSQSEEGVRVQNVQDKNHKKIVNPNSSHVSSLILLYFISILPEDTF